MDYNLDDTEFEKWQAAADCVRARLDSDGYRDDVCRAIDTFSDVNTILEEYGFDPINTIEELGDWANA